MNQADVGECALKITQEGDKEGVLTKKKEENKDLNHHKEKRNNIQNLI